MNEQYGPFSPYGGYVWSTQAAQEDQTWIEIAIRGGVAATVGGAAWWQLTRTRPDGSRHIDTLAYFAQQVAHESPFQFLSTFRAPEWMSPATSVHYQGLAQEGSDFVYRWDFDVLHNEGTYQYLKKMAGLSDADMASLGFTRSQEAYAKMHESMRARELIFRRTRESALGDLFVKVGDEEKLFVRGARMMQLTPDAYDIANLIDKRGAVNRAFHSVLQALDMWATPGFDVDDLFTVQDPVTKARKTAPWAPIIAEGPVGSLDELWRRSSFLRAPAAFGMERFNRMVSGLSEQIGGEAFARAVRDITGFGLGTVPAPASKMFWRFGTKAAGAMALYYGLQETDWIRRQGGIIGHVAMAGVTSAGLSFFAGRMGASSRAQAITALGAFATQMIAPGFEKGVWPGIVQTYANLNVLRAGSLNPFNYFRRTLEGFLPGITDWQIGGAIGAGVLAASYVQLPPTGKTVAQHLVDFVGPEKLGLPIGVLPPDNVRQHFWQSLNDYMQGRGSPFGKHQQHFSMLDRMRLRFATVRYHAATTGSLYEGFRQATRTARDLWMQSEDIMREGAKLRPNTGPTHPYQQGLIDALSDIAARYSGRGGFTDRIAMQAEGLWTQAKYAFFGVNIHERSVADAITGMGFKSPLGRGGLLFIGTLVAHQLLTGGMLGSLETSEDLQAIYSGRKLVEVKKGRFWEGGGTPFEGGRLSYHRPHYVALTLNRVREKGIWGEDEDKRSPLYKAYLKNFTYELEKEQYWDRPYPITHAAFQDVPIIGGFLAQTIGRLIKPPRIMHPDEWLREDEGGLATASVYQGWRREPSYALGAETVGKPIAPLSAKHQLPVWQDQFRELEGLTGWAKSMVSDQILGFDIPYSNALVLADSGRMSSDLVRFWENQMGGAFFMNEAIRRIFPSVPGSREYLNPIMNTMPGWLPEDLHYGDPYRGKFIEWGEALLPGPGYEALHPELKGTPPEDYPLIYQYDILSTVAPYSKELRRVRQKLYHRRAKGEYDDEVNQWMDEIDRRVQDRYQVYDFTHVHPRAIELPGSGLTQSFLSHMKLFMREAVAPIEYLIPMGFRPVQKLLGDDRSPIERYEYERLYGTPFSFWDRPWRDWFRPAAYSTLHNLGFEDKPGWRKEVDATNAYFDKLEFLQFMRAAEEARMMGDAGRAFNFEFMASTTLAGVDPGGDPVSLYWAIPREDRAFFNAFASAPPEDRQRILEMVPENQARIYQTIWDRIDQGDPSLYPGVGRPKREYLYARRAMIESELAGQLPAEDWIGWHPDIDMEDIKVRYIDQLGKDISDYGLWESDLKKSMRQPYLEGAADPAYFGFSRLGVRAHFMANTGYTGQFSVHGGTWHNSYARIEYNDTRSEELRRALQRNMNGY